jgi:sacsin
MVGRVMKLKEVYIVCQMLGAGRAREMACEPSNLTMKLMPWAGIAALISSTEMVASASDTTAATKSALLPPSTIIEVDPLRGRGYCFLPLPVETRLPVHVNGYFELSSNRRDIWFGDDMAGDGRLRAEWNDALLADVVAPAYARLLAALATLIGNSPHDDLLARYYERFAVVDPPLPWNAVSSAFWGHLEPLAVLHTKLSGGQWAAPAEAIISSSSEASVARVAAALICDGAAVCQPPADVATRVLAHCDQSRELKPPLVRERMRDRAGAVRHCARSHHGWYFK